MNSKKISYGLCCIGVLVVAGCTSAPGSVGDAVQDTNTLPNEIVDVQLDAWLSGRIVYADFGGSALVIAGEQGDNATTLIEGENPTSPAVSGNGRVIAFSQRERNTDQLTVIFKDGRIHRFNGITGHDPLRVALNHDGSRIAFQELTPASPVSACGPIHLALGNTDGSDLQTVVSGDSICAEWPEWSPDGTLLAYAHVDLSAEHPGRLCLLDGTTAVQVRCFDEPLIGISHRTWSPDSTLLMGQGFRTMRVSDGEEVTDPLAEVTGGNQVLAAGELMNAILNATAEIGWTLIPAGVSGDLLPISVNWGPNHKLVFDGLAAQADGNEGVHLFTYDLTTGATAHLAGPFPESNTNNHNYSLLCPRWIP